MARVAVFGVVERIPLNPRRTTGRGVCDHAIEQSRRDPVPSEWWCDDETCDSDHGRGLGSVGIDISVKPVVRP
jgi:hypothetical protein